MTEVQEVSPPRIHDLHHGRGPVMLGFIHGGTVRAEFMVAVLNILAGPHTTPLIGAVVDASAGPLIAMARNMLVARFLESELEWLWCVDTDIVFEPGQLERLYEVADPDSCPIISALYWVTMKGDQQPAAYTAGPDADGNLLFSHITECDQDSVIEIDGVGAGCLLIHRSVLERIREAANGDASWFREVMVGYKHVGEDLSFCMRLAEQRIPLHLHTGVEVGHVKPVVIGKIR